jgi:hypothetical protein
MPQQRVQIDDMKDSFYDELEHVFNARSVALNFFPIPDQYPATYRHPSAACLLTFTQTLPLSSLLISHVAYTPSPPLLYSWLFPTGGSVCSHLLTLVPRSRIFLP